MRVNSFFHTALWINSSPSLVFIHAMNNGLYQDTFNELETMEVKNFGSNFFGHPNFMRWPLEYFGTPEVLRNEVDVSVGEVLRDEVDVFAGEVLRDEVDVSVGEVLRDEVDVLAGEVLAERMKLTLWPVECFCQSGALKSS